MKENSHIKSVLPLHISAAELVTDSFSFVKVQYFDFYLCSDDCHHFGLEEPNFSMAYSISKDIESCAQIWALYEEFQQGLQEMAKEDWITYRFDSKTIFMFL